MMSIVAAVARAVASELEVGKFSIPFKPVFAFRHDQALPEGKELRVTVVPKGVAMAPASRGACAYDVEVWVAIMRKLGGGGTEILDPLLGLVEEITDFFRLRRLEKFPEAMWTGTELKPVISAEHLEGLRQFSSLVAISFKVVR